MVVDTTILELKDDLPAQLVTKELFQEALLEQVPLANVYAHKEVVSLHTSKNGGVHLHFRDGTASYADAVIGADLFQASVRDFVFGDKQPALSSKREYRVPIPIEVARELLDQDGLKESSQHTWIGKGGDMTLSVTDSGGAYCCVNLADSNAGGDGDLDELLDYPTFKTAFE